MLQKVGIPTQIMENIHKQSNVVTTVLCEKRKSLSGYTKWTYRSNVIMKRIKVDIKLAIAIKNDNIIQNGLRNQISRFSAKRYEKYLFTTAIDIKQNPIIKSADDKLIINILTIVDSFLLSLQCHEIVKTLPMIEIAAITQIKICKISLDSMWEHDDNLN